MVETITLSTTAMIRNIIKKRSLRELAYVYGGTLASGISLFLVNVILGRSLGKEEFALFALAILVLSMVAELSDFGLNSGLLRFVPFYAASGEEKKLGQVVRIVWKWRLWLSALLTVGGIALAYPLAQYVFKQPPLFPYLIVAFLGVGGTIFLGFLTVYLQARQRFFYTSLLQGLKGLSRLIVIGGCILFGVQNLLLLVALYALIPWVIFLFNTKVLPPDIKQSGGDQEEEIEAKKKLSQFSFWVAVWSFSAIIAGKIDQIMISNLLGLSSVAVYAIASQLLYVYALASQSINTVLLPKVSALQSREELIKFVLRVARWCVVGVFGLAVLIYPSQYLILFFFGAKYAASLPVYLVLAYSYLITFLLIPFSLVVTVLNKTVLYAVSGVLQLASNIILNFLFIPQYGVMGAAYAFGIGIFISFLYYGLSSLYLLKKKAWAL